MKKFAAPFLIGIMLSAPISAATLARDSGPAELPPSGFTGTQFVDSKGCVYIRAGRGGIVNWVPCVTRQKQVVCGYKPSFAKTQTRQVAAVQPAPKPVVTPKPAPKVVAKSAPVRTVASTVTAPVAAAPKVARKQAAQPVAVAPTAQVVRPANPKVSVPKGYRNAWNDDRLNVKRAVQSAKGIQATDLMWTRTVPRQLIHVPTGQDVTRNFSKLMYPFTDITQQQTYLAAPDKLDIVARADGAIFLVPKQATASVKRNMATSQKATTQRRVASTKAAPKVSSGAKYVQVGTFGVASNATETSARLKRLGLPVRTQKISHSGKSYTVVMAGPFSSRSAVKSALSKARGAGFSDAFAR